MLSDTDRLYSPEFPHAVPIAYALKGYSLACDTMRAMTEEISSYCHKQSLSILATSFDGQWANLSTRDASNKPLNQLQLQRDV